MSELGWEDGKRIRYWGDKGSKIITVHGGPGAVGDMGKLSAKLSTHFQVIEPWQRISGTVDVTVNQHIEDLHSLISKLDEKPALVGHSWGAMLALAYAAYYPDSVNSIALVGCGTFDEIARKRFNEIIEERKNTNFEHEVARIEREISDESEQMMQKYNLISKAYDFDLINTDSSMTEPFDYQAHKATWDDMMRLMNEGKYPQEFTKIKQPVAMFHGDYDPHPGEMIYKTLKTYMPQLEYFEFPRCGHSPWNEKHAKTDFIKKLITWLKIHQ